MRIEVDQPELSRVAVAVDAAASVVAAADLAGLARDVAAAMPGSRSAPAAASAAAALAEALAELVHDLAGHADAVREAALRYDDTDRTLAVSAAPR